MKNPKAQILLAKFVLNEDDTELFEYYEDAQDSFVYCFFGDLEIDGDLRLDWKGYGDATNYAEGFCIRYNIRSGVMMTEYCPIIVGRKEVEHPVRKAGIVPGDTIHTINGYPFPATDTAVIYAGSPKQVEVEYTHLGEFATTIMEPCYVNEEPKLSINGAVLNEEESPEEYGICVLGNLKVNGSIVNRMKEGGPMLYVKGNLEADNLIAGGSFVEVRGTTTVKHYVYGHYNDGIMRLEDVVAKAVISSDHDLSVGNFVGPSIDDLRIEKYFDPKYKKAIDAMLDGADMIKPVE